MAGWLAGWLAGWIDEWMDGYVLTMWSTIRVLRNDKGLRTCEKCQCKFSQSLNKIRDKMTIYFTYETSLFVLVGLFKIP
jgi:hypothetical protein